MHPHNCQCKFCTKWKKDVDRLPRWQRIRIVDTLRRMPVPEWLLDEADRLVKEVSLSLTEKVHES